MKPILFIFTLIINTHFLFAQAPAANTCPLPSIDCLNTPYNGTLDLANPATPHSISATPIRQSYAKSPLNSNFHDVKYVNDDAPYGVSGCPLPANDSCNNDGSSLVYDVYYPTDMDSNDYKNCPLPAVILFHAGGFIECTNLLQNDIVTMCKELAKRGFVVFSVEYRVGRIKDSTLPKKTTVQQQFAVYRACQDARGAIRSIILRQLREGANGISDPYRINPDKIFVGGFSAGGLIAMNASWYTPNMVYAIFQNGGTGSATIQQALGSIDADFYYASKTALKNAQNQRDYQQNIIGNACMWGAINIPISYIDSQYAFFDSTLLKPLISFQGRLDKTFYYADSPIQNLYFHYKIPPPVDTFNSTGFCSDTTNGKYFLDQHTSTADLKEGSTLNMRNILFHYKKSYEHYVDCDMGHGFSTEIIGTDTIFHGNFGVPTINNSTDACTYLAKRIATYFQAVLNGNEKNLGTNYFPDCQNTRTRCNPKTTACTLPDCEVH